MMTLLTNLTSSLSAAADSSDSSLLPSSMGPPSISANIWSMVVESTGAPKSMCKRFFELSMGGYAVTEFGYPWKTCGTMREPRTASGIHTSPQGLQVTLPGDPTLFFNELALERTMQMLRHECGWS